MLPANLDLINLNSKNMLLKIKLNPEQLKRFKETIVSKCIKPVIKVAKIPQPKKVKIKLKN